MSLSTARTDSGVHEWCLGRRRLLPVPIEGNARQDKQQTHRRAARSIKPYIRNQRERTENKEARHPGITPATIRTRHAGLRSSQAKQGHDGEAVENPSCKNKKIGKLLEGSRESHDTCEYALKEQPAARRAVFRMDAVGYLEENSIARHRVGDARAAED